MCCLNMKMVHREIFARAEANSTSSKDSPPRAREEDFLNTCFHFVVTV